MHFTIITPSFNQLDSLKRCVASVADQETEGGEISENPNAKCQVSSASLSIHHHVQDACSTDGTGEFLKEYESKIRALGVEAPPPPNALCLVPNTYSSSFASEADEGMYDAINKGVAFVGTRGEGKGTRHQALGIREEGNGQQSTANNEPQSHRPPPNAQCLNRDSVVAWLNCDEQYLPGTMEKVAKFFETHPDIDLLFGGMLVVDEAGDLLACRKAMPMRNLFLEASYLYNYSCAMFFRAPLWNKMGGFDTDFKNAGDEDLICRAMKLKVKCSVLNDYLSTFTYSDTNLSSDPAAVEEHERLKRSASFCGKVFRIPLNLLRLCEKFLRGGHVERNPLSYGIYTCGEERVIFLCEKPNCLWPDSPRPYLWRHRLARRGGR